MRVLTPDEIDVVAGGQQFVRFHNVTATSTITNAQSNAAILGAGSFNSVNQVNQGFNFVNSNWDGAVAVLAHQETSG
jgi:hypothetical protein